MTFINYASREINCKIVYYGPGLCGKTTNLQYIFDSTAPQARGKLISLATETDRTLFFDFMPLELGTVRGFKTRFARGKQLPRGSMAYDCARNAEVDDRARAVHANVWFDTQEDVEIVEHSAPVSEAGGVITLLWVPDRIAIRLWPLSL